MRINDSYQCSPHRDSRATALAALAVLLALVVTSCASAPRSAPRADDTSSSDRPPTSVAVADATTLPKLVLDGSWVVTGARQGGPAAVPPSGSHVQILTTVERSYADPRVVVETGPQIAELPPVITPPPPTGQLATATTASVSRARCYGAAHVSGAAPEAGRAEATCEHAGVRVRLSASRFGDADENAIFQQLSAIADGITARPNGARGVAFGTLPLRLRQVVEGDVVATPFRTISFRQPSTGADAVLSVQRGDAALFARLAIAATSELASTVDFETKDQPSWVEQSIDNTDHRLVRINSDVITDLHVTGLSQDLAWRAENGITTADEAAWHAFGLDSIPIASPSPDR